MATNETSPAKKTYCVWADCNRRVYQEIDASGPEEAHRIAEATPEDWQFCSEYDPKGYHLSNEVEDVESSETFTIGEVKHCKTCGSQIVETINDSNFNDGECGPCEYDRYKSQPSLLEACERMKQGIDDMLDDDSLGITSACGDLLIQVATMPLDAVTKAKTYGTAA